jgi:hypothetical protein
MVSIDDIPLSLGCGDGTPADVHSSRKCLTSGAERSTSTLARMVLINTKGSWKKRREAGPSEARDRSKDPGYGLPPLSGSGFVVKGRRFIMKALREVTGFALVIAGLFGLLLPIVPGVPLLVAGVSILGTGHPRIQPWLERIERWRCLLRLRRKSMRRVGPHSSSITPSSHNKVRCAQSAHEEHGITRYR